MNITSEKVRTPKFRTDLVATSAEESGVVYFDVKDPRTGNGLRLYHFEWLVAQRMDGERTFDEIATWARNQFGSAGWAATAGDFAAFAERLRDLGLIEVSAAEVAAKAIDSRPFAGSSTLGEEAPVMGLGDGPAPDALGSLGDLAPSRMGDIRDSIRSEEHEERSPLDRLGQFQRPKLEAMTPWEPPRPKTPKLRLALEAFLVVAAAGFLGYYYVVRPVVISVRVHVQAAPPAAPLVRYHDGEGKLGRSKPVTVNLDLTGRVLDVIGVGADVKPGTMLVTLETYTTIARELADVRDREAHYQEVLKQAEAKGIGPLIQVAKLKLDEKHKVIAILEEKAKATRLLASTEGLVEETLVKPGDNVKPGMGAVRLVERKLLASFPLPAGTDLAAWKVGLAVAIRDQSGKVRVGGKVSEIEGQGQAAPAPNPGAAPAADGAAAPGPAPGTAPAAVGATTLQVELDDDANGALRVGDIVRLEKAVLSGVVRLPATVLAKTPDGKDRVFVSAGGVARSHPVTVVERSGDDVEVSQGVNPGDLVILQPPANLSDGRKLRIQP